MESLRPLIQNTDKKLTSMQTLSGWQLTASAYSLSVNPFRARRFFTGSFWSTGWFRRRSPGDKHPAVDEAHSKRAGICPWLKAQKAKARVGPSVESNVTTGPPDSPEVGERTVQRGVLPELVLGEDHESIAQEVSHLSRLSEEPSEPLCESARPPGEGASARKAQ